MDHRTRSFVRRATAAAALLVAGGLLTACSATAGADTSEVRIGYFPNVTHAPGLIADSDGLFEERFAEEDVTVSTQAFNAGPDVIQAILSGSLDISYIGPNPTVTAYIQSNGEGVRVIAGSTSGGASLVVRPEIASAADLKGKKLATPQLGNTQDIALRHWLTTQNLTATEDGGGDVIILPQSNSAAVQSFRAGEIDGGWLPEPFASRLVEAGGVVLVDERDLWPDGEFVTTNVIARTEFVEDNPELVRAFIDAHLDALDTLEADPTAAQATIAQQIKRITEQDIDPAVLQTAWGNIDFTANPLAETLKTSADHAEGVGLLPDKPSDGFAQLWDLTALNEALKDRGLPEVTS